MRLRPGDHDYGRCVDCGKLEGYTQDDDGAVCRACYGARAGLLARSSWARAHVFDWLGDWHKYLATYTPQQLAKWEADAPKRAAQRAAVQANLDAYARGEFPGDRSLMYGVPH